MIRNLSTGIDLGTQTLRIGVASGLSKGEIPLPKMVSFGTAESTGLRQGCIIEKEEVLKSLREALRLAEKNAGARIKRASLAGSGIGLGSLYSSSEITISRADMEITDLDVEKLKDSCEKNISQNSTLNRKILHVVPVQYKLDGKTVLGDPIGMKGTKLEVKCLFITFLEKHLNNLVETVEEAGVEVSDVVAAPVASGLVLLTKQQKKAGCILADIGAETVSVAVFENNIPISLEVFPTGGNRITNDIALGLKISLGEAEHVKLGGVTTLNYPRKKLEEIIEARLSDIFDMIDSHLKKINRSGLLPAGIIFGGNGSNISGIEELAKSYLKLPAKVARIQKNDVVSSRNNPTVVKDVSWATVYGLCLLDLNSDYQEGNFGNLARKASGKVKRFFKQFIP
jgi:cell division protein FtsA